MSLQISYSSYIANISLHKYYLRLIIGVNAELMRIIYSGHDRVELSASIKIGYRSNNIGRSARILKIKRYAVGYSKILLLMAIWLFFHYFLSQKGHASLLHDTNASSLHDCHASLLHDSYITAFSLRIRGNTTCIQITT